MYKEYKMEKLDFFVLLAVFLMIFIIILKKKFDEKSDEIKEDLEKQIQETGLEPGIYIFEDEDGEKGIVQVPDPEEVKNNKEKMNKSFRNLEKIFIVLAFMYVLSYIIS